jgi:hypothetical protein
MLSEVLLSAIDLSQLCKATKISEDKLCFIPRNVSFLYIPVSRSAFLDSFVPSFSDNQSPL